MRIVKEEWHLYRYLLIKRQTLKIKLFSQRVVTMINNANYVTCQRIAMNDWTESTSKLYDVIYNSFLECVLIVNLNLTIVSNG